MAARPKDSQKISLDYNVDREIYDMFVRTCSRSGYAPQIVVERLMKKYADTGQM